MNELYIQLGIVESTLSTYTDQIKLLKEQKRYLIKTIENYANQSIHTENTGIVGVGATTEAETILDKSTS